MGFEIMLYTTLFLSVVFLLSGLLLMILGRKNVPESGATRVEIEVLGNTVSTPYHTSFLLCVLGIILLFMAHSLFKDIDEGYKSGSVSFSLIGKAYAQEHESNNGPNSGWVYFGFEKDYRLWNFEFITGNFQQLMKNKDSIVLQSIKDMNIRKKHFGNFTGTFLGFLNPEPEIIGKLEAGACIEVVDVVSVGHSKVWVQFNRTSCP